MDYVLDNYVSEDATFPPILWAEEPSEKRRTNNRCESFHCHYNEQFYSHHPSSIIMKIQVTTYIRMRTLTVHAPLSKVEREKQRILFEKFELYKDNENTRCEFIKSIGYKFRARTDIS